MGLRRRIWGLSAIVLLALASPAAATLDDFLGDWANPASDAVGVERVTVTRTGGNHIEVYVTCRCDSGPCDLGTVPGVSYSDDPASPDMKRVTADFQIDGAKKRVTLTRTPTTYLRFEVLTEFTGNTSRSNFVFSGDLGRPVIVPTAAPAAPGAPAPTVAPPPPPAIADDGGFLTGVTSFFDEKVNRAGGEECVPFNPDGIYIAPTDAGVKLLDFGKPLLAFGTNRALAERAKAIILHYRFDEQCFVARPGARMMYWKSQGTLPTADFIGQDCLAVDVAQVKAVQSGGAWLVTSGGTTLLDFGDDKASAEKAAAIIVNYRFTRQCFVGRPNTVRMQYWLSK